MFSLQEQQDVHDTVKQGLVTYAIAAARQKTVPAYVGDGLNRWPAAHVLDVALLYRLALEKNEAGAKYQALTKGIRHAAGSTVTPDHIRVSFVGAR